VAQLTVLVPIAPVITNLTGSQTAILDQAVSFAVGATSLIEMNYQWLFNARIIPGATNALFNLSHVQTNSAGVYSVIVANSAGAVTSAPVALTVTVPRPLDLWVSRISGAIADIFGVAYGNGLFVAVGDGGLILTSVDGSTWTDRSVPGFDLHRIAFANGTFVAVGKTGTILTSTDSVAWVHQDSGTMFSLKDVAYGDGVYVAVGVGVFGTQNSIILRSTNAVDWSVEDSGLYNDLNAVTFAQGLFVAAGDNNYDFSRGVASTNGITWVADEFGTSENLRAISYGAGRFIAVGNGGTVQTSLDGGNFSGSVVLAPSITNVVNNAGNHRGITYANGLFVLVGNGGNIFTSVDGETWVFRDSGTAANLHHVAYGNSTFVAVGKSGTILQSGSFAPAQLTVRARPGEGGFELGITGEIGRSYRVQASDKPGASDWLDLFSFKNTDGATTLFLDSAAPNFRQRFYRVVSP
jgi:hypothetical protein